MSGLVPMFTMRSIMTRVTKFVDEQEKKAFDLLSFVGEDFINRARELGSYTDQTGNLRSSIGYAIVKDGRIAKSRVLTAKKDAKGAGKKRSKEFLEELASKYPQGLTLIVVAGMEYAAAVESRGKSVLTEFSPRSETLVKTLRQELGLT